MDRQTRKGIKNTGVGQNNVNALQFLHFFQISQKLTKSTNKHIKCSWGPITRLTRHVFGHVRNVNRRYAKGVQR